MDDVAVRKRIYGSGKWKNLRARFLKLSPNCVVCGRIASVVDHVRGHGDDWQSHFYDQTQWQSMCASCHSRKSVEFDHKQSGRGIGAQGVRGGQSQKMVDSIPPQRPQFRAPGENGKLQNGDRQAQAALLINKLKAKS